MGNACTVTEKKAEELSTKEEYATLIVEKARLHRNKHRTKEQEERYKVLKTRVRSLYQKMKRKKKKALLREGVGGGSNKLSAGMCSGCGFSHPSDKPCSVRPLWNCDGPNSSAYDNSHAEFSHNNPKGTQPESHKEHRSQLNASDAYNFPDISTCSTNRYEDDRYWSQSQTEVGHAHLTAGHAYMKEGHAHHPTIQERLTFQDTRRRRVADLIYLG